MAAKLSSRFKSYLVASITQSLKAQNPPAWAANTLYNVTNQVTSNRNIYAATKSGSSGVVAPSASSGVTQDGTVTWLYIGPSLDPSEINSNLYLGLGRTADWPDELNPPAATADETETRETLAALVTLLRMTPSNTRLGLKKNEWVSGTVYDAYTGMEDDADNPNLYVTVDSENIYKCIDNNNGAPSTIKPNVRQQGFLTLSDGYVWKYIGSVSNVDLSAFGTADYLPVQVQLTEGTDQWLVQTAARAGEVSSFVTPYMTQGSPSVTAASVKLVTKNGVAPATAATVSAHVTSGDVDHIFVSNPGAGYDPDTWAVVKDNAIADPTTPGTATVNLSGGVVTSVTIGNTSSGYVDGAVAYIIGDGTGATVSVVLDGDDKLANINVTAGGSGYTWANCIIVPGTVAWLAKAIMGPFAGHGKNIATELSADTLLISVSVSSTNAPYVTAGEFRQVSLVSSVSAKTGSQANALAYIGPEHPLWNSTTAPIPNKYAPNTGQLLYLNNIPVVNHQTGQEETIKIAITF